MAMSWIGTVGRGGHLVGGQVRWPGPQEGVGAGRNELQCCNRSRYHSGQQSLPLPGTTSSDPVLCVQGRDGTDLGSPVGARQGDGQVPGRDGVPGLSPGGTGSGGLVSWFG